MPVVQLRVTDEAGTYLCAAHGLTNDLTWAEERSAVALANYVLRVSQEVAQIARLGACQLVSWPVNSSTSEEEEEEEEEQERDPELPVTGAELEQSEEDEEDELEPNRWQHSQDWEAIMGEEERLAYDDS